jgi:cyclic pyranopterin phosphate synthase
MPELTHFDDTGAARMVDVGDKAATRREAIARGRVFAEAATLARVQAGTVAKGDVLQVARLAGIMAAKRTSGLIPLCHPLPLSAVELSLAVDSARGCVEIEAHVRVLAQTGVEMEALTAVAVAALTVYDMCKSLDKHMVIGDIRLVRKTGGRSGTFERRE